MASIISVKTSGRGAYDVTDRISENLRVTMAERGNRADGVAHLLIQHTSASLTIQENADPDVLADLADFLDKLAPEHAGYRHSAEGPDDCPAHLRSVVTTTTLSIPVAQGSMMLGQWQGIYLLEHRRAPHHRQIAIAFTPE